jgi:glucosamine--fructose-6-phosphate aminotransferase (isomerizing)
VPVIAVALEKLQANLMEVRARGGELVVFADPEAGFQEPIIYTIPLQLLAYHVALLKGTDVDQPRNLAKGVTME